MKEIKILIKIDEEKNRVGFAIQSDKEKSIEKTLQLVSLLELLKRNILNEVEEKVKLNSEEIS